MGGEGSMLHMILSLRNNKKLRSKKSIFEKQKSFFDSTATSNAINKKIEVKHLTQEEIEYFREKSIRMRRKYFINKFIVSIILISILAFISAFLINTISEQHYNKIQRAKEIQYSKDIEHYNIYLKRAANFESDGDWPEAIFELKHAIVIFPEKIEANIKLADTYIKACTEANIYCDAGIEFISKLINKYPDNNKLYELRAILYNSVGENEKANNDYKMIN